jgi:hypothetical protein
MNRSRKEEKINLMCTDGGKSIKRRGKKRIFTVGLG